MFVVSIEWGLSLGGGGRRIGRFRASLTELTSTVLLHKYSFINRKSVFLSTSHRRAISLFVIPSAVH